MGRLRIVRGRIFRWLKQLPVVCVVLCGFSTANPVERNLVVLVDRSKSVEAKNRESAFRLIGDLVAGGKMSQDSRDAWKAVFPPAAGDEGERPERANLRRFFEGGEAASIAPETGSCLVAGLGNYQRTRDLRESLARGLPKASRAEMGAILAGAAALHGSDDNSTHIKLAESILAQHLIQKSKNPSGYYLIVITDEQEDCFNLNVNDYDDPAKLVAPKEGPKWTRSEGNERVAKGELDYDDGLAGKGRYKPDDLEAIGFREKVEQLLLAEFQYTRQVEAGKRAVKVQVYAQAAKRALEFSSAKYEWVYPGKAPEIRWMANGVSPEATLILDSGRGKIDDFKGSVAAKDGEAYSLPLADSLAELFPEGVPVGEHSLELSVVDANDPRPLKARASVVFALPEISFDEEGYQKSNQESPAELDDLTELAAAKFRGRLSPAPGECVVHARIQCDGEDPETNGVAKIPVDADGRFSMTLVDFPEEVRNAVGNSEIIRLTAMLPKEKEILGNAAAPTAQCYLKVPRVQIWADGYGADVRTIRLDLRKRLGVTFKASLAGLPGYSWAKPSVQFLGSANPPGVLASGNVVSFDKDAEAGVYNVTMGLFRGGSPVGEEAVFRVEVPKGRNWTLITLAAMALASCALFGWHFLSRR
jgi:hypothetical protein